MSELKPLNPSAPPTKMTGPRILLRSMQLADELAIYRIMRSPEVTRHLMLGQPYKRPYAAEFIRRSWHWRRLKKSFGYAIVLRETNELIGSIGLMRLDWKYRHAEIGYSIAQKHWGRGYMPEAVRLLTHSAFHDLELERVFARVFSVNPSSARVLEKVGYSYEGTFRHGHHKFGKWLDVMYYGIIRSEWRGIRKSVEVQLKKKSAGR